MIISKKKMIMGLTVGILLISDMMILSSPPPNLTEKNVYVLARNVILIHNVYELQNMSKDLSGNYALANDIDATITKTWNNGAGFVPIGNDNNPFSGIFDGKGHKIINLWINRSSQNYVELFGYTSSNAMIENVGLVNVSVSGSDYTGGLVGVNYGIVNNSYATGNVSGSGWGAGGLVGANSGTVNKSYSTGSVSGNNAVGGLVGDNNQGMVSNSYATGNVNGDWYVGGLVGYNSHGTVNNSYATGNLNGDWYVGGLVGENYGGTVTASFWDVETSGIDYSRGGTGKTTAEMKNKTTFLNAGWDFTNIWGIVDGQTYPYLLWSIMPRELKAEAGVGFVNLTWKAPANKDGALITGYNLYRNGTKIAEVPATQLYYNDTNVVNGVTYTYYVTAVNSVGESDKSNEVQATPSGEIPEITRGAIIIIVALLSLIIALRKRKN